MLIHNFTTIQKKKKEKSEKLKIWTQIQIRGPTKFLEIQIKKKINLQTDCYRLLLLLKLLIFVYYLNIACHSLTIKHLIQFFMLIWFVVNTFES